MKIDDETKLRLRSIKSGQIFHQGYHRSAFFNTHIREPQRKKRVASFKIEQVEFYGEDISSSEKRPD